MIEKVARAINEFNKNSTDETWLRYRQENSWMQFEAIAKVAIQAMREPSEEMLDVFDDNWYNGTKVAYLAMIDAALKE